MVACLGLTLFWWWCHTLLISVYHKEWSYYSSRRHWDATLRLWASWRARCRVSVCALVWCSLCCLWRWWRLRGLCHGRARRVDLTKLAATWHGPALFISNMIIRLGWPSGGGGVLSPVSPQPSRYSLLPPHRYPRHRPPSPPDQLNATSLA